MYSMNTLILASTVPGPVPNPWMIVPFVALLACIAILPFISADWWGKHYNKVAVGLGLVVVCYYLFALQNRESILHVAKEYVSFIALIGSLFVVSGGIHIQIRGQSTPSVNCVFLLIGAVLANIIGTTGASMLLIRPWIRMNQYRVTAFHVVFFIFIVSNVGGCLTPVGDPPLFLGYLKGVPFWWVLQHCFAGWAVAVLGLIAIFYAIDRLNFVRAPRRVRHAHTQNELWRFDGAHNVLWLVLVLAAVFISDPEGLRELLMVAAAVGSYFTTRQQVHQANHFNFHPIKEVAWLFAGIFATMVPALEYLEHNSAQFGVDSPMKFYWFTGMLSSVLDNAPTYLTFLAAAFGKVGLNMNDQEHMKQFIAGESHHLVAISLGAVFFGAMTYIGNGPNFMVKSIAEQSRVNVPTFFGYIAKYSLLILLPFLALVGLLFFSRWAIF